MNYTDAQIQAAIDAAFPVSYYSALIARNDDSRWPEETSCRLAIARAFLAELEKIKPARTLPPPPAGHKWHREDWTEEMLPEGYRPLVEGETIENQDEYYCFGEGPWLSYPCVKNPDVNHSIGSSCFDNLVHHRTRRPLPFWSQASAEFIETVKVAGVDLGAQPEEPAWIPHDGGPCPFKPEHVEEFQWKLRDGKVYSGPGSSLKEIDWAHQPKKTDDDIIAYRVLKWKPGYVPEAKPKPETFEAHGKTWLKHTPGDPRPCDGEAMVEVLLKCEFVGTQPYLQESQKASHFFWSADMRDFTVVGWRYADEQPEQETPEEAKAANLKAFKEFQDELHATWENADEQPEPKPATPCRDCKNDLVCADTGTCAKSLPESPALAKALSQPWQPAPGDVVRLKSGGPEMTVMIVAEGSASVIWALNSNEAETAYIPTICLEPAKKH